MPLYRNHTEDERQHISAALKGKPKTSEHRKHLSLALEGKRRSPATEFKKGSLPFYAGRHIPLTVRAKLSAANKGKHSSRQTEFREGLIPWNKGIRGYSTNFKGHRQSEEARLKMIANLKGRHLHMETEIKKGQHVSVRTEFTSEQVKARWQDPDYRAKVIAARLKKRRPTGPEKKLIEIIERNKLPFKYTGDGSFILEGLNPDFIEVNGRKIAIDVFGDYWHTLKADKDYYTEDGRKAIFVKYGWSLIIIWEHQLKMLSEEKIVARIKA